MKSLQQINNEILRCNSRINDLTPNYETKPDLRKDVKRLNKELSFLESVKSLLQFQNTTESYLSSQAQILQKKIDSREENFKVWVSTNHENSPEDLSVLKAKYNKEFDVPKMKQQLKFIQFILND